MPLAHVHKDVEVAPWSRITACDRTKYAHPQGAMTSRGQHNLVPTTAQLFEGRRHAGRAGVRIRLTATLELPAEIAEPTQRHVCAVSGHAHKVGPGEDGPRDVDRPPPAVVIGGQP